MLVLPQDVKKSGLHLVHISITSLLPKIDEFQYNARGSEAAFIGISDSKLGDSVLSSEIQIENYDLIRSDRNKHGGSVGCLIRKILSYNKKSFLTYEIESLFTEIFLPKPLIVGTMYGPPSHGSFTEIMTEYFLKINTNDTEIYILGDLNINLVWKQKYIFNQMDTQMNTQSMSHKVKNHFQFCFLYGLEQLIKSPTPVTCSISFLTNHILTTFSERDFLIFN